jgi:tetratricopeptide (TPR) repeat protein
MGTQAGSNPMPHEVRLQLDRMLGSGMFTSRPQQAKLLKFIVREALAGREVAEKRIRERIFPTPPYKEDSNIARRTVDLVRNLLAEYYAGPGKDDPVIVTLPQSPEGMRIKFLPGTAYRPSFVYNPNHKVSVLYRLGRHYLSQASPQALENAFDKFQQVIDINPDHTDALLGIVEAHFPLVLSGYTGPGIREQLERMAALAREAVKRQPGYWRAHAVLGAVLTCRCQLNEASKAYRRAKRLDEEATMSFPWFAVYSLTMNRRKDAVWGTYFNSERFVDDAHIRSLEGFLLYVVRRFDQAEEVLKRALTLDSGCWFARLAMSLLCLSLDRPDDALEHFQHMLWLAEDKYSFMPGLCYLCVTKAKNVTAANRAAILDLSSRNLRLLDSDSGDNFQHALRRLADGNRRGAVSALIKAREEGHPLIWWLHLWPVLDPLPTA